VLRLAEEKALTIAHPGELVLGADTTVLVDGEILGKPADADEARWMLRRIAGREHTVLSGVAIYDTDAGRTASTVDSTRVLMAEMDDERIAWYVATGEPMDKAGAYAIQGLGALIVEAVYGSYTNVVGLPLPTVRRLFAELGYDLRDFAMSATSATLRT
jgi:septum formation protein